MVAAMLLAHVEIAGATRGCHMGQPQKAVILTVEGQIKNCNVGLEAKFDLPMLEALPKAVVKTKNPWEAGLTTYEGVPLADLLEAVNANGTVLRISALNDYRAEMPVADTHTTGVILAYRRNGAPMPVSEKGPLIVVFPFTANPLLEVDERFAQSVWQVVRITVK